MTPERAKELMEQAAVMIAAAEGKEIEYKCRGCSDDDYERLIIIELSQFDWHDYEYRIKKVPTDKYIPFTAETFKEHRERWIRMSACELIAKVSGYNSRGVLIHGQDYSYAEFMKYNFFDDTGEPCGQKVE